MEKILKQSSWLFFAQIASRIISFFYTFFLAQNLGVDSFGLYTVALTYFSLTSIFADFGFNRFLIREIAKNEYRVSELLFGTIVLRLAVATVIFVIFAITLFLIDPNQFRVTISILAILAILPQSISLTLDAMFMAFKKLQYSATGIFFLSVITALLGVLLIDRGIYGVVFALIVGQILYVGILYLFLRSQKIHITKNTSIATLKEVLIGSFPYGLLGVLGFIYFRVDTLMLNYMKGNFDTGIYGLSYKFLEAVVFIPSALGAALFPVLAQLHSNNIVEMKKIYYKSFLLMGMLGLLLVVGYVLILPYIIRLFLPTYIPAIEAVQILAFTIPFMFIHTPGVQILLASDKYVKTIIFMSLITLSFNVIFNFIFIPQYGYKGAAWVTVVSEALSFAIFYVLLQVKVFKRSL